VSVLTRRTMGVASLGDGEVEYMLARRLIDGNDNQGPYPLNEEDDIRDTVWVQVGTTSSVEATRMPRALELEHPIMALYIAGQGDTPLRAPVLAPITPLPDHVWLDLSVRHSTVALQGLQGSGAPPLRAPEYMVRLQNLLNPQDNHAAGAAKVQGRASTNTAPAGATATAVQLGDLRVRLGLVLVAKGRGACGAGPPLPCNVTCTETTLTMQQSRATNQGQRLQWRAEGSAADTNTNTDTDTDTDTSIRTGSRTSPDPGPDTSTNTNTGPDANPNTSTGTSTSQDANTNTNTGPDPRGCDGGGEIELDPLDIRTFVLTRAP